MHFSKAIFKIKVANYTTLHEWTQLPVSDISGYFRLELNQLHRLTSLQSFNSALTLTAGKVVVFVTFMLALASGHVITAQHVFTAMMLFETLRVSLSILLPSGLLYAKDMFGTIRRVQVGASSSLKIVLVEVLPPFFIRISSFITLPCLMVVVFSDF